MDKVRKDLVIYETDNYGMFKRLEGNRDIKAINKIVESVMEVGYIPNPVIINEKFEVVDGQNRLEALKKLEMPVQYYMIQGIGIEEARALNLGRTNWKPIDYVKSYAESGNESYQILLKLVDDYKGFSLQEIYGVLKGKVVFSGWHVQDLNNGKFIMNDAEYHMGLEKLEILYSLRDTLKQMIGSKRLIITTLGWCMDVKGCDKNRIKKIVQTKYPFIRPAVTVEFLLQDITKLYNKNLSIEKQIDFDVLYRRNNV